MKYPLTAAETLAWLRWEHTACTWNSWCLPRWGTNAEIISQPLAASEHYSPEPQPEWNNTIPTGIFKIPVTEPDCGQDGNLLMTEAQHMVTPQTAVLCEALWALLDHSGLCQHRTEWHTSKNSPISQFARIGAPSQKTEKEAWAETLHSLRFNSCSLINSSTFEVFHWTQEELLKCIFYIFSYTYFYTFIHIYPYISLFVHVHTYVN